MKKAKIILPFFILILAASCNNNPIEPPIEIISKMPQWGMFMHDGRHTGNVNTRLDNIYGPSRDSVKIKWRIPIDGGLIGSPAIADDGTIYFGTHHAPNWDSSSVYAVNPNGTIKWRYTPIKRVYGTPAIGNDGSIYVGTMGGGFYAFSSSGQLKWIHNQGQVIQSSAAIGKDGTIYYTDYHYLYAVNPSDGSTKWQVSGGDDFSSPSISADGTIYYSNLGTITAVSPEGKIKWTYKDSSYTSQNIFSTEIGSDGTLYFMSFASSPFLYAIDNEGKLKWKYMYRAILSPCIDGNDNIYFAWGTQEFASVSSSGNLRWSTKIDVNYAYFSTPFTIGTDGIIYTGLSFANKDEPSIMAFRQNIIQWKFGIVYPSDWGNVSAAPAIYNGSLYFAWEYGPNLYFYCLQ